LAKKVYKKCPGTEVKTKTFGDLINPKIISSLSLRLSIEEKSRKKHPSLMLQR